jgi:hypothetical protein
VDTNTTALEKIVRVVLKGKLGFNAPSISINGCGLYEEGEDADEDLVKEFAFST